MVIIYCAGSLLLHGFPLVVASRGYSPVTVHGLLIEVASLVVEQGLKGARASVVASPGI